MNAARSTDGTNARVTPRSSTSEWPLTRSSSQRAASPWRRRSHPARNAGAECGRVVASRIRRIGGEQRVIAQSTATPTCRAIVGILVRYTPRTGTTRGTEEPHPVDLRHPRPLSDGREESLRPVAKAPSGCGRRLRGDFGPAAAPVEARTGRSGDRSSIVCVGIRAQSPMAQTLLASPAVRIVSTRPRSHRQGGPADEGKRVVPQGPISSRSARAPPSEA